MNASALPTESSQYSAMFMPPTVTARISFLSLRPWQVGQGTSLMQSSISARMYSLFVS